MISEKTIAAVLLYGMATTSLHAAVPTVLLSDHHQAMCRVLVGDVMPELALQTPNGDSQDLSPVYGQQATVVVFHPKGGWMTEALLRDLGPDVAESFGTRGVALVTVALKGAEPALGAGIALVDRSGSEFAKVGEGKLPRIYVLDSAGKIVWFDIEYSNSTRRELRQTLESVVSQ